MCEIIARGDIVVSKVRSQDNPADMITKSLSHSQVCALFILGGTWLLSFALYGFVVENEYGFDLILRYEICWHFLFMMGIRVKMEIIDVT